MASSNTVFFSDDEESFDSEDRKPQIQQTIAAVVPPTYADETLDTQVLLKSWNIKRDIIETVVAAKLTIWHLRVIEDDDIARLFGTNIADCVEFKYYLKKWRSEGAKLVEAPLPQVQIPQQSLMQMPDPLEQYNALAAIPFPPEPIDRGSKDHMHKIRRHASREEVERVLKMSARGKSILLYYNMNQKLETQHQAWLVDILADYYLQKYDGVSMKLVDRISDKIVELFPTEQKETYYTRRTVGGNPKGKLHDKFRNKRRLYISQGILKKKKNN
ncbi:uncharacterized protein LOC129803639 [Phlebotomus papatasi]|uniref:uncharacterized protein LOC129803639 n=1 Tax=Phlebotomus papatasi TaxID=29031 RepID=UPI002483E253|nr:uncharacterized protein LOC129803639 [Phlebotomus papatasi]